MFELFSSPAQALRSSPANPKTPVPAPNLECPDMPAPLLYPLPVVYSILSRMSSRGRHVRETRDGWVGTWKAEQEHEGSMTGSGRGEEDHICEASVIASERRTASVGGCECDPHSVRASEGRLSGCGSPLSSAELSRNLPAIFPEQGANKPPYADRSICQPS